MKILESEPTLAKWSPDGEKRTSWTNFVCVLIVYVSTRSQPCAQPSVLIAAQTLSYLNGTPEGIPSQQAMQPGTALSTLMEDDGRIVCSCCGAERSLLSDAHSIDSLWHKGVTQVSSEA